MQLWLCICLCTNWYKCLLSLLELIMEATVQISKTPMDLLNSSIKYLQFISKLHNHNSIKQQFLQLPFSLWFYISNMHTLSKFCWCFMKFTVASNNTCFVEFIAPTVMTVCINKQFTLLSGWHKYAPNQCANCWSWLRWLPPVQPSCLMKNHCHGG